MVEPILCHMLGVEGRIAISSASQVLPAKALKSSLNPASKVLATDLSIAIDIECKDDRHWPRVPWLARSHAVKVADDFFLTRFGSFYLRAEVQWTSGRVSEGPGPGCVRRQSSRAK